MELIYFTYNHNLFPPFLPIRTLPFYDLTFVIKGSLTYSVNGQKYVVKEGEAIFLPTGCIRERVREENRATYVSFNFTSDEQYDLPTVIENAVGAESNLLLTCAEEIKRKYYPNGEKQIELLCQCLLENLQAKRKVSQEHALIIKIKHFVNEHFPEKITLQKIGELTYFSPLYCDTVFKRETGTSIIRYVIWRRMEEAKKLLSEGALPLKKVAETVGFEDYNYFARAFKKWTGATPREYKTAFGAL